MDDLATAHLASLLKLKELGDGHEIRCNLGTGHGATVLEVIDACERVVGKPIKRINTDRRPGDPPELVADASTAERLIGWKAKITDIEEIIASAWNWHSAHPNGFDD